MGRRAWVLVALFGLVAAGCGVTAVVAAAARETALCGTRACGPPAPSSPLDLACSPSVPPRAIDTDGALHEPWAR